MTISISELRKDFGAKRAVDIATYTVRSGERIGLVGSNGAGKTTLLRLMLDLIEADTGSVLLGGINVAKDPAWKGYVGSYLDDGFLIDYLTADEYFAFVGALYGMSTAAIREALAPYQPFYPDEPFGQTTKYIRELSLGNRKKIGVIAAMFVRPKLLILDEPFANLDPPSQIRLKQLLRALSDAHGTTQLVSSHDLGHVTDICTRITLLEKGLIARDTPTSDATQQELEQYFTFED